MGNKVYEIIGEGIKIKTDIPLLSLLKMEIDHHENEHGMRGTDRLFWQLWTGGEGRKAEILKGRNLPQHIRRRQVYIPKVSFWKEPTV